MDNWNSQPGDIEWVDQIYQLLLEIARSSLSDIPRIPENITLKSLPLIQKLQSVQQREQGQALKSDSFSVNDFDWVAQVRQLLEELTGESLSERPKMPENMAGRALSLADRAQTIKETIEEKAARGPTDEDESSSESPDALLDLLHQSLKTQRAKSYNPDAPQWQQIFTLLDVVQSTYKQIKR
ncbi:inorganic pyrophosphatase [Tychonema sp. LEGE 07203]|uniref:inorganic pyrophosphatase n=1 Tax=Tychonema sp. LEGE 07203 TaxID=1828671 RepID=UPI001880C7E2|nr:inorganic pyrophosphatase [Tychonema sp. LEGE 07203]MBE9093525.1 inorganic pyrophosphatase [Tychonema sp. LEGE 07203]